MDKKRKKAVIHQKAPTTPPQTPPLSPNVSTPIFTAPQPTLISRIIRTFLWSIPICIIGIIVGFIIFQNTISTIAPKTQTIYRTLGLDTPISTPSNPISPFVAHITQIYINPMTQQANVKGVIFNTSPRIHYTHAKLYIALLNKQKSYLSMNTHTIQTPLAPAHHTEFSFVMSDLPKGVKFMQILSVK